MNEEVRRAEARRSMRKGAGRGCRRRDFGEAGAALVWEEVWGAL